MNDHAYLMQCEELAAKPGADDICIVDCRFDLGDPQAGYRQYLGNHIPGAMYADLDRDLSAPVTPGSGRHPLPDPAVLARKLGNLGIGNETTVVCYDQASGAIAARLWWLLRWMGHERACLLDGGFERWKSLGLPTEAGKTARRPAVFRASPDPSLVLTTEQILADGAEGVLLVDARDPERFAGRVEPIDRVAGRIPGSINIPFSASLAAEGTWKAAPALVEIWKKALGARFGSPWSVMCGSGVTACHLVVSGLIAGLPEPRVYVGSWSEWITDPERPVEAED